MVQAEELRLRTVAAVANPLMQFTHRAGAAQVDLDDAARGAEQCGSLTVQKCPPDLPHPAPDTRPAGVEIDHRPRAARSVYVELSEHV